MAADHLAGPHHTQARIAGWEPETTLLFGRGTDSHVTAAFHLAGVPPEPATAIHPSANVRSRTVEGAGICPLPRSASVVEFDEFVRLAECVEVNDRGLSYGRVREYLEHSRSRVRREYPRRTLLLRRSRDVRAEEVADTLAALERTVAAPKVGGDFVRSVRSAFGQRAFGAVHVITSFHGYSVAYARMRAQWVVRPIFAFDESYCTYAIHHANVRSYARSPYTNVRSHSVFAIPPLHPHLPSQTSCACGATAARGLAI